MQVEEERRIQLQTIKIRNLTALTDFSVLFRAALYLSGDKAQAEEGGIKIKVRENRAGRSIIVKETDGGD